LRIGEALNLRLPDIRSNESLIYIRGGKGKKDRRVPLSAKLLKILRAYYKCYRPRLTVFEGPDGGRYSNSSAAQVLHRSAKRAGITSKVTLHTLRHSYATHLTNKGVNIQYLQEILGHNSPKTTMLYTHLSGKDISKIRSPLDDMDI
ncbi:MAG: tyrosine-type recombinase/integrase, partial [Patescibacteria group bacterium]